MIARRPAGATDQERFKIRPLIVGHQSTNQGCSPQRTALNQFMIQASIDLSTRPRQTPLEIIDKFNKEINSILADPNVKARIADIGGTVLPGSPADFGKLIADETEKWGKVIRAANIKPE
jgi:hypothetical protein